MRGEPPPTAWRSSMFDQICSPSEPLESAGDCLLGLGSALGAQTLTRALGASFAEGRNRFG